MLGLDFKVRFMENQDFDRVIEIDYTSGGDYSWSPDDLFREWKNPSMSGTGVGIVAIDNDDFPLGFCIYELSGEFYEMKHLVVDKSFQRQGIGTSMINKMKEKLNDRRYILSFNVPESNLSFQLFLKKMGFKATLMRCCGEDFLRFQYEKA